MAIEYRIVYLTADSCKDIEINGLSAKIERANIYSCVGANNLFQMVPWLAPDEKLKFSLVSMFYIW